MIRLFRLLSPEIRVLLPPSIQQDMRIFLERIKNIHVELKVFGVKNMSFNDVITLLRQVYC